MLVWSAGDGISGGCCRSERKLQSSHLRGEC